jgi:hypothetical protein
MRDGLFELKSVEDLFRKLEYDFQRLKEHPASQYAAFDFFVTAEHMLDWQLPGDKNKPQRKEERKKFILLGICSNIANGAKHFSVYSHHNLVVKTSAAYAGFQSNAFQSNAFQATGSLIVKLDGDAAKELGEKIGVLSLAEKVIALWKKRLEAIT